MTFAEKKISEFRENYISGEFREIDYDTNIEKMSNWLKQTLAEVERKGKIYAYEHCKAFVGSYNCFKDIEKIIKELECEK